MFWINEILLESSVATQPDLVSGKATFRRCSTPVWFAELSLHNQSLLATALAALACISLFQSLFWLGKLGGQC